MSVCAPHPTPYPAINGVLHMLLSGVQTIVGERFLGMYLSGSLASGDFDPQRSDIDFVVVTTDELPSEMLTALAAMHAQMAASGSPWVMKLEGAYIPQRDLRRYDPAHARHPSIGVGEPLAVTQLDYDWVLHRHILREHGVVVAGPAPHTLIDPVQPNGLRRAVLTILHTWWAPMLDHPVRLHRSEYQPYAVLTMCRMLYTLQHGTIVSKPVAARWAQAALDERWSALIERALAWQPNLPPDDVHQTQDFIRYTLERSQQSELPIDEA